MVPPGETTTPTVLCAAPAGVRPKMAAGEEGEQAAEPAAVVEPEAAVEEPRSFKDLVRPSLSRFCPRCSLPRPEEHPPAPSPRIRPRGSSSHSAGCPAVPHAAPPGLPRRGAAPRCGPLRAAGGPRPGRAARARWGRHVRRRRCAGPRARCCARAGGPGSSGLCSGEVGLAAPVGAPRPAACVFSYVNLLRHYPFAMLMGCSQRGGRGSCMRVESCLRKLGKK